MSQLTKKSSKRRRTNRFPLILVGAGAIVVIITTYFAISRSFPPAASANFTPDVKGAPSIKVDKDKVDLGYQKLGATANVSFTITNNGDQPLHFTKQPYIEVKEGC